MSWEAFYYQQECPEILPLPGGVTARDIALAFATGRGGYRTVRDKQGNAIWYLPEKEGEWENGWYAVPLSFEQMAMKIYSKAIERACRNGSAGPEEIEAEVRAR